MSTLYNPTFSSYHSYRFPYRKSYGFIVFAIILLIMSWESSKIDAALISGGIPEEAIRLRILANSDSPGDQLVKRIVRDEVVKAMATWANGPQTIEEARATIQSRMVELQAITRTVLESRGFDHSSTSTLGIVDFPTKIYGNQVYPAGQYEALLITIGAGQGQNWWCVLFPPLCFIDSTTGEASAATAVTTVAAGSQSDKSNSKDTPLSASSKASAQADASSTTNGGTMMPAEQEEPKVEFFLWKIIKAFFAWLKALFS